MIRSEEADLEARLRFHFSDEMLEVAKGLVLGLKGEAPHMRGLVTCEGDGKTVSVNGGGLDRTDEVTVDLFDGELRALGVVLRGVVGSLISCLSRQYSGLYLSPTLPTLLPASDIPNRCTIGCLLHRYRNPPPTDYFCIFPTIHSILQP